MDGTLTLIARLAVFAWLAVLLVGWVRGALHPLFYLMILAVLVGTTLGRFFLRRRRPSQPPEN
jgi:Flp pilus assembly protein TadB